MKHAIQVAISLDENGYPVFGLYYKETLLATWRNGQAIGLDELIENYASDLQLIEGGME